uniref:Uncharacterized protein n=1 Tax=Arundo donax TaxID=35708 RepID=A0A0A9EKP4_ARUDO
MRLCDGLDFGICYVIFYGIDSDMVDTCTIISSHVHGISLYVIVKIVIC